MKLVTLKKKLFPYFVSRKQCLVRMKLQTHCNISLKNIFCCLQTKFYNSYHRWLLRSQLWGGFSIANFDLVPYSTSKSFLKNKSRTFIVKCVLLCRCFPSYLQEMSKESVVKMSWILLLDTWNVSTAKCTFAAIN